MTDVMQFISASTTERNVDSAVQALTDQIAAQAPETKFDLVMLFLSAHFDPIAPFVSDRLREVLQPRALLGCTCEGVIGPDRELENRPAISMIAARLPDVRVIPFSLNRDDWDLLEEDVRFGELVTAPKETQLFIIIGDSYSMPTERILDAFNRCYPGVPMVGGMASGATNPGGNTLILDDRAFNAGAIGVALSGNLETDVIVSQGCRPFGPIFTVTQVEGNVISGLDDKKPLPQIENLIEELSDVDRDLLRNGLFVGRSISTRPESLGRGDFLIRTFMGADRVNGSIVVADYLHTGEKIQFHLRDQSTAKEDLEMLLMPQIFDVPPNGGLLFSCNSRGTRLYDHPNGDISTIQSVLGGVHLAGFFCAGEFGPIGDKNFLHGHTASMVLFRPQPATPND
ncbi:MAG: FIST C-terminal domain-containing protein [Chloroflexi bacterium]|nr:FIST C-terminal domain-containing protein [Chloroflexota bacterium]